MTWSGGSLRSGQCCRTSTVSANNLFCWGITSPLICASSRSKSGQPALFSHSRYWIRLLLSAVAYPHQEHHSLESSLALLGVSIEHRHSALSDAEATAQVFLKLLPLLAERGIITLGQAIEASKKTPYARLKY